MTDFANIDTPSTVLTDEPTPSAAGGGAPVTPSEPTPEPKDDKPISIRESLDKAAKAVSSKPDPEAEPAPKEEKPEVKPKAEEAAKEEPKAEGAQEEKPEPKPSEGRRQVEAPARLLPQERELWKHVPRNLQGGLDRVIREADEAVSQHKEASERYSELREYDDLARQNGTTLKDAVSRYHALERLVAENPVAAMNQILMDAGPKKPDGQPYSLWEMANSIAQGGPEKYHQVVGMRQQQQAPQEDPQITQLKQQMAQMEERHLQASIVAPFQAQHPRFDELSTHIATFLKSDIVPRTLEPADRLAHAYDMADRLYPKQESNVISEEQSADRQGDTSTGSKSIKSTPGSVSDDYGNGDRKVSIREAIEIAGKKAALRG